MIETQDKTPSALAAVFSRLVAYTLPIVYFLVTVSFYLRTYDSAQIKITLTQVGCTLVILFWFAQLILERRWPIKKEDLPVLAPFLAYLGSGIVSYAQSSFHEGSTEEFIRRVLYVFMGLVVILEFRGWDRHRRLLRWLLAAFGVVVFYGFIQFFDSRLFPPGNGVGLDPFVWRMAFATRVFSTFGNPNFYGNFLVIITPIIIAMYLRSGGQIFRPYVLAAIMVFIAYATDKVFVGYFGGVDATTAPWYQAALVVTVGLAAVLVWWKTPTAAASGMLIFWAAMFLNLYATDTKGAWMGFTAAFAATTVLVGFFFVPESARKTVRKIFIAVVIFVIIGASVVVIFARRRIQSVNFRVFTWIATWEMIRTQPVLGTGIGSFKWAYPAFRRPEIIQIESKSNTETDHSEDEYLETWFDEGMVGFGIFLWMILTASVLGVRALSSLTKQLAQGPPGARHGSRAYSLLAFLGAYWGGLAHWFVDVSVRFVSSGIYSVLLPGIVTSLVMHKDIPYRQDTASESDRWIRLSAVGVWLAVLLSLKITVLPALLCCAAIWGLGEVFEWRLTPEVPVSSDTDLSTLALQRDLSRTRPLQLLALAAVFACFGYCYVIFRGFFMADINHNIAIFFSKAGVWAKSPEYDSTVASSFPPEMQQEYKTTGGAVEHYETVVRKNPYFPMARYFIGNVYNDWGSSVFQQSQDARQKGDAANAEKLRDRANQMWDKALLVYARVKKFAPNYVQTHHQVGLVYMKKGDLYRAWGDETKAREEWTLALQNFALYHNLDPVFPPNYYRMAYIHFAMGQLAQAEQDYMDALAYNKQFHERNAETFVNAGRMLYVALVNKNPSNPKLDAGDPLFERGMKYFESGLDEANQAGAAAGNWGFDSLKGMAILYSRAGVQDKAIAAWQKLRELNPNDPDVQRVFQPAKK